MVVRCPYCGSTKVIKNGWYKYNDKRVQKYLCKECGKTFILDTKHRTYTVEFKKKVIDEVRRGLSIYEVSRKYGVPQPSVSNWCKKYGVKSHYSFPGASSPSLLHIKNYRVSRRSYVPDALDGISYVKHPLYDIVLMQIVELEKYFEMLTVPFQKWFRIDPAQHLNKRFDYIGKYYYKYLSIIDFLRREADESYHILRERYELLNKILSKMIKITNVKRGE